MLSYFFMVVLQKSGGELSVERATCAFRTYLGDMPLGWLLRVLGIAELFYNWQV